MEKGYNFKEELKKQEEANAGSLYLDDVLKEFDEFISRLKEATAFYYNSGAFETQIDKLAGNI